MMISNKSRRFAKSNRFLVPLILFALLYGFAFNGAISKQRSFPKKDGGSWQQPEGAALSSNDTSPVPATGENYFMKGRATWNGNLNCPLQSEGKDPIFLKLKDFFREETKWKEDDVFNIFLTESSCDPNPAFRVWCSIESMAKVNPDAIVWYVMTSPEVDLSNGLVGRLLKKHPNLRLVTVDLAQVFGGTPIEKLYNSGAWLKDTDWPAVNLSEMMRMALVWHAGGFYSDTDVICISPLKGLRNVIGMESFNLANCAGFHFDQHHRMLEHFMAYQNENFDPHTWGNNGPQVVTAVLRNICGREVLSPGLVCEGAKILHTSAFNPIQFSGSKLAFQKSREKDINKRFPDSYTIHFWNRVSHDSPVIKNSGSIYDLASASFCPISREEATKKSPIY